MLIKAAAGALVRDPFTKLALPTVGGDDDPVEASDTDLHWARLLTDGDIVLCDPPAPAPAPAKSAKAAPSKDDQA